MNKKHKSVSQLSDTKVSPGVPPPCLLTHSRPGWCVPEGAQPGGVSYYPSRGLIYQVGALLVYRHNVICVLFVGVWVN